LQYLLQGSLFLYPMSFILHHIKVVEKLIGQYKGATPFAAFLKEYFSKNKQHGSKDRKGIANLCYTYFRLSNSLKEVSFEEKLKAALFLCNNSLPVYAQPLFTEDESTIWPEEIEERLVQIKKLYPSFNIAEIIPYSLDELSEGVNKEKFLQAHLFQPKLFVRIRKAERQKQILNTLNKESIAYTLLGNDCLELDNSTDISKYLKIDEEVVIQDYSSQRVATLFKHLNKQDMKVWDCCAASGGKSILLYDYFNGIHITATDVRQSIIMNLKDRFRKAGITRFNTSVADASIMQDNHYDLVIADAPCTGSGTWSRTPEYLTYFKTEQIKEFAELQKRILTNVATQVKSGGFLIYITCSALKQENEEVVKEVMAKHKDLQLIEHKVLEGYNQKADTMFATILQKH